MVFLNVKYIYIYVCFSVEHPCLAAVWGSRLTPRLPAEASALGPAAVCGSQAAGGCPRWLGVVSIVFPMETQTIPCQAVRRTRRS